MQDNHLVEITDLPAEVNPWLTDLDDNDTVGESAAQAGRSRLTTPCQGKRLPE